MLEQSNRAKLVLFFILFSPSFVARPWIRWASQHDPKWWGDIKKKIMAIQGDGNTPTNAADSRNKQKTKSENDKE